MNCKGQGSIEYLLIIGAAIMLVAIVIIALVSISQSSVERTESDFRTIQSCQFQCVQHKGKWDNTIDRCILPVPFNLSGDCANFVERPTPTR